jgi:hypothetical protein
MSGLVAAFNITRAAGSGLVYVLANAADPPPAIFTGPATITQIAWTPFGNQSADPSNYWALTLMQAVGGYFGPSSTVASLTTATVPWVFEQTLVVPGSFTVAPGDVLGFRFDVVGSPPATQQRTGVIANAWGPWGSLVGYVVGT